MPRCARIKDINGIYHIMVRSVGNTDLFVDDTDKDMFLQKIRKYQERLNFKVYAYCLMDTHAHMIVDSNGGDISDIMHGINQSYAQNYNRKYKRHGHLFADRFKSKVVAEESYLFQLSGYIHQNAKDLPGYSNRIDEYPFSSLGIYIGKNENKYDIVDTNFVLCNFGRNLRSARRNYIKFVGLCTDQNFKDDMEFTNEKSEYRSERKILIRDFTPDQIANYISGYLNKEKYCIYYKNGSSEKDIRSIFVFLTRLLCGYTYKKIAEYMGDITISQVRNLFEQGFKILKSANKTNEIIRDLINIQKCIDIVSA